MHLSRDKSLNVFMSVVGTVVALIKNEVTQLPLIPNLPIDFTVEGSVIVVKLLEEMALSPMVSNPSFRVIEEKAQPKKAFPLIVLTDPGTLTEVKPAHSLKALIPIMVTVLGIVTDVICLAPLKAATPIAVTE